MESHTVRNENTSSVYSGPLSITQQIPREILPGLQNYWAGKKREQRSMQRRMASTREDHDIDDRDTKKICSALSRCWRKQTNGLSEGLQGKILQQLLQHPTFSVLKPASEKLERLIFSNICHTLSEVKTPHSNNELFLKRATVMACLNGASGVDNQMSGRQVAKALGLHQRNVIAANVRLQLEADEGSFPLGSCHRQMHRTSIITTKIREIVFQFWSLETRISPNKKDVVRKRIGKCAYVLHPVHLLDLPQVYHCVQSVL